MHTYTICLPAPADFLGMHTSWFSGDWTNPRLATHLSYMLWTVPALLLAQVIKGHLHTLFNKIRQDFNLINLHLVRGHNWLEICNYMRVSPYFWQLQSLNHCPIPSCTRNISVGEQFFSSAPAFPVLFSFEVSWEWGRMKMSHFSVFPCII